MILPQVFSDVGVALDIGVVEDGGVVARGRLIDPAGQRAETGSGVDRHHILWAAFPEDRTVLAVIVVLPTPPLPETNAITYCFRICLRMRSRSSR